MSAASVISVDPSRLHPRTEARQPLELTVPQRIRRHGFATFYVADNRMFPWVRRGDLVFIRRIDFGAVQAGDCILAERGSRAVLRRVLRRVNAEDGVIAGSALLIKSYAHGRKEEFVTPGQFLGRAVRIHRGRKHIDMESLERKILAKGLAGISYARRAGQRSGHFVVELFAS